MRDKLNTWLRHVTCLFSQCDFTCPLCNAFLEPKGQNWRPESLSQLPLGHACSMMRQNCSLQSLSQRTVPSRETYHTFKKRNIIFKSYLWDGICDRSQEGNMSYNSSYGPPDSLLGGKKGLTWYVWFIDHHGIMGINLMVKQKNNNHL